MTDRPHCFEPVAAQGAVCGAHARAQAHSEESKRKSSGMGSELDSFMST